MSLQILYEEQAINQAAGFLTDDPEGLAGVLDAIDHLIDDPRPATSFPYGSADLRRLRVGRYRVLVEAGRVSELTSALLARRIAACLEAVAAGTTVSLENGHPAG